jgi:hypothetical protein
MDWSQDSGVLMGKTENITSPKSLSACILLVGGATKLVGGTRETKKAIALLETGGQGRVFPAFQ